MQTGANKGESRGITDIDNGAVKSIVSCTYPLTDARKAFEASWKHKAPGKMISLFIVSGL